MNLIAPESCKELTPAEQPKFFSGQLLTTVDLEGKNKQHNRYLHGSGVVCGLWVVPTDPQSQGLWWSSQAWH
jgi:hypothetical protein